MSKGAPSLSAQHRLHLCRPPASWSPLLQQAILDLDGRPAHGPSKLECGGSWRGMPLQQPPEGLFSYHVSWDRCCG